MASPTTHIVSHSSPFEELFGSGTLVAVLSRFALEPEHTYYQRELMRATGTTLNPLQRELARLEAMGLVRREPRGKHVEYSIDTEHPAWEPLRELLLRTVALADVLRVALSPISGEIDAAFVFGSFASGKTDSASDVDLMVIGAASLRDVSDTLHASDLDLHWEINPVAHHPNTIRRKLDAKDHFITSVISGPKIWLVGDDELLEESLGRRDRQSPQLLH